MNQKLIQWLEANLGDGRTAPLTGTDRRALEAAVATVELYSYQPTDDVALAFGILVKQMQPRFRHFAFHAIAMVMDWSDRHPLWIRARLGDYFGFGRCENEPVSSHD